MITSSSSSTPKSGVGLLSLGGLFPLRFGGLGTLAPPAPTETFFEPRAWPPLPQLWEFVVVFPLPFSDVGGCEDPIVRPVSVLPEPPNDWGGD